MANNRISGVAYLKVDGVQYALRGSLKVQPNLFSSEGLVGQDGVHGFKQMPIIPSIEGDISDLGGLSIQALVAITDSTVTAELANGKVYVLSDAWYAGEPSLDTVDGKLTVKFEGLNCTEVVA